MSEETTSLPPKVNPLGDTPAAEAPKVKPVLRKPVLGGAVHPAMPKPPAAPAQPAAAPASSAVEQLKTITQNLKSITAPIPQQAILRNTGIIGSQEMTEAQKAAAAAVIGAGKVGIPVKNAAGREGVVVLDDTPPRKLPTFENALEQKADVDESDAYSRPVEQKTRFEEWNLDAPAQTAPAADEQPTEPPPANQ